MGPNSRGAAERGFAATISPTRPFRSRPAARSRSAAARARASRITYVGELGWELYVPTEFAVGVFDAIVDGRRAIRPAPRRLARDGLLPDREGLPPLGARHLRRGHAARGGARCSRSARTRTPASSAATRCCAGARRRPTKRLLQFALRDPEPLLYGNEPVWLGKSHRRAHDFGRLWAHARRGDRARLRRAPEVVTRGFVEAGGFEIEVAGRRVAARASVAPMYDPKSERIRG